MQTTKVGEFIKQLREEKGISQNELAEKLFVTRQAISSWENGKNYPHLETLKLLSDIFQVDLIELYAGKKVENKKTANEVIYTIVKNEKKKQKRLIIIFILVIVILLISFFVYYFINTYNATKIYRIGTTNANSNINGIMIKTQEVTYFQLIEDKNDIEKMSLFYKDKEIYQTDGQTIIFREYNGYNEYHSREKDFLNNLSLKIITEDKKEYNINLILDKEFENKSLLFKKSKEIGTEKSNANEVEFDIPQKIKEQFIYKDGNYELELKEKDKKITMFYFTTTTIFLINEVTHDNYLNFQYDVDSHIINISKTDLNYKIIFEYSGNLNEITNDEEGKYIKYFKEKYLKKYIDKIELK